MTSVPPERLSPHARPYVDALPRFNIVRLDAQAHRGAGHIYWFDQHDAFVGAAAITVRDRRVIELAYIFEEIGFVDFSNGSQTFDLRRKTHSDADDRPAVICPGCGRLCDVMLFLDRQWKCRKCHDVTNLSTLIDNATRKHLELQEVSLIVERARQRYMRNAKYNSLIARHKELMDEIGAEEPRTLAAHHRFRVEETIMPLVMRRSSAIASPDHG